MNDSRLAFHNDTEILQGDGYYIVNSENHASLQDTLEDIYFAMYDIADIGDWIFTNIEFRDNILEWIIVNNGE